MKASQSNQTRQELGIDDQKKMTLEDFKIAKLSNPTTIKQLKMEKTDNSTKDISTQGNNSPHETP